MSGGAWIAFVGASAAGALARWVAQLAAPGRRATFAVNVSGSLLLGAITGLAAHHGLDSTSALVLGTGFCGSYTTFSTFALETVEGGGWRYAGATVVAGAAAAAVGLALASL